MLKAFNNRIMLILGFVVLVAACGGNESSDSSEGRSASSVLSVPIKGIATGRAVAKAEPFVPIETAIFTTFESGQVRPLAQSPDGNKLFAVNTPDGMLEIFTITSTGLLHEVSVPVGLEPVAVAARNNDEVWVINHLSDSISVIDVSTNPPRVIKTLLVGDEPRDIVFAGTTKQRAFITTAHRGQNSPYGPASMPANPGQSATPGIGRADVWVFDAANTGSSLGGSPETIVTHFTDTPRALAVSTDGSKVYAAGFMTGNQTTVINEGAVCDFGQATCNNNGSGIIPGPLPSPSANVNNVDAPNNGIIVKFNPANNKWEDELGTNRSGQVFFNLPDADVFVINANANPPVQAGAISGVGTAIFNMAVNPQSGKIYVSNTEARNEIRFEGARVTTSNTTVNGHLHESRITVIDGATVLPRHLNKHINYSQIPAPAGVKDKSLAIPMQMAVSSDGNTLYLAAFGSSKIAVFDTATLEDNSFTPDSANHISVTGGGASGVILDEVRSQLYVMTRFDNAISVIDTNSNTEVSHIGMHNPEPVNVIAGRQFLYDANHTSSNGEASCASCHLFADFDSLAWDLGDPEGVVLSNPNPLGPLGGAASFHPMKGPMTTQSLRGMDNHGPLHWRGDRTAGHSGGDPMDEAANFKEFNVAFPGLLGRATELLPAEMDAFTNFIIEVTYPPNPNRLLDNSLTVAQAAGSNIFFNVPTLLGAIACNVCHLIDPASGNFGSSGLMSIEAETQDFKIPHLRNMYQKVGMFGMPINDSIIPGDNIHTGNQIRGFGFLHDGSVDTLARFHDFPGFDLDGIAPDAVTNMEQFMMASDSNLKPIVGQQATLSSSNSTVTMPRIQLMFDRMDASDNQVVVKMNVGGEQRGAIRKADGNFQTDDVDSILSETALLQLAQTSGQELTFTAVPNGSAVRMGIDRDGDLLLNLNDNCPDNFNPGQEDSNNDGVGDVCEPPLPACLADFDNDGDVDGVDASIFSADFGRTVCTVGAACEGDFDSDNDVDGVDAAVFASEFGRTDCPI